MEPFQEAFIKNLKEYRGKMGISQAKFAEMCDVSNGTIGNIECGNTKPSFDLIITMCRVLNCTPSNLFSTELECGSEELQRLSILEQKIHATIADLFKDARKRRA